MLPNFRSKAILSPTVQDNTVYEFRMTNGAVTHFVGAVSNIQTTAFRMPQSMVVAAVMVPVLWDVGVKIRLGLYRSKLRVSSGTTLQNDPNVMFSLLPSGSHEIHNGGIGALTSQAVWKLSQPQPLLAGELYAVAYGSSGAAGTGIGQVEADYLLWGGLSASAFTSGEAFPNELESGGLANRFMPFILLSNKALTEWGLVK